MYSDRWGCCDGFKYGTEHGEHLAERYQSPNLESTMSHGIGEGWTQKMVVETEAASSEEETEKYV